MLHPLIMNNSFKSVDTKLFFQSQKLNDARLGEVVKALSLKNSAPSSNDIVIVGYPDDEGVKRNLGRTGSRLAPEKIRENLYKLSNNEKINTFYDGGDFVESTPLEERQIRLKNALIELHKKKSRIVSLGGGNDYAYPDVSAFLYSYGEKALVIHIDAHFDMRPIEKGANSGTPILQCFNEFKKMNFHAIGIQECANSPYFFKQAKDLKVKTKTWAESHGQLKKIFSSLSKKQVPTFLAIDMDAFSDAFAPGVSAPQSIGLDANEFYAALPILFKKLNVRGVGIYETNPELDIDNKTSRLAARFVYNFLLNAK